MVWRGDARQALLARLLAVVVVEALDDHLGRAAGALLGRTGHSDVMTPRSWRSRRTATRS